MGWYFGPEPRQKLIKSLSKRALAHTVVTEGDQEILWAVQEVSHFGRIHKVVFCYLLGSDPSEPKAFGYKPMDETMGPRYYSCPIEYLDLATEPITSWSIKWREKIRELHRRKGA